MKGTTWIAASLWLLVAWLGWTPWASAQFSGVYTDKPGYAPGETIFIHGSAPPGQSVGAYFRLVQINEPSKSYGSSKLTPISHSATDLGSFIEIPSLTLAGRTRVTLEGWWYPTIVGTDTVSIIGQIGKSTAAAGIIITPEGKPAVYGSATASALDLKNAAIGPDALKVDRWYHLAAVFDGAQMRLYVDGKEVAAKPFSQAIASAGGLFRIGARREAPGDMTGIIDGRLDAWTVWPNALSASEINARISAAKGTKDPTPPVADVLLYLGFEEPYGGPKDSSSQQHKIKVVNLGVPHITGVNEGSLGFGLHHDQVVDAGHPEIGQITIPKDAPSGLYVLHAITGPQITPLGSDNTIAVTIRPTQPKAKIAVIVPVNTWLAYNTWPGKNYATSATPGLTARPREPGGTPNYNGGNNSAYDVMGDGVSYAFFQGWRRPMANAQPFRGNDKGFHQRATVTRFMFEWLDREKLPYDAYTDWDVHSGALPNSGAHKLWLIHGHAEYWSRKMLDRMAAFLDGGGSVVALAGNMMTWRVTLDGNGVMEIRKWPVIKKLGQADTRNAMDQKRAGSWIGIDLCEGSRYGGSMGSVTHMAHPCSPAPDCFGKWAVKQPDHWLWKGLGVKADQRLGSSPVAGIGSVGHETDVYHPSFPPWGLKPGTTPTILAEGRDFPAPQTFELTDIDKFRQLDCTSIENLASAGDIRTKGGPDSRSGHIYLYQHKGGGHVLVAGSTSAPWGALGDTTLSAMFKRAIDCFAHGTGCPSGSQEPAKEPTSEITAEPQPDASRPKEPGLDGAVSEPSRPEPTTEPSSDNPPAPSTNCGCDVAPSGSLLLFLLVCLWIMRQREPATPPRGARNRP